MRFTLEIDLGNDAMRDEVDVACALREVANRIDHELPLTGRPIRDTNGNTVGKWELS